MKNKNHLGTQESESRDAKRQLKKVISNTYQGSPPILTQGIDQVGLKAKTVNEVRDTDFPILKNIDDQTSVKADSYDIDLSLQEAHFHRIIIADEDDASAPITNIDINFINLPINKEVQFTIEFIKDPALVTFPTVTFSPLLEGVPASFPAAQDRWYFLCSARTLPDNTTRFQLLNVSSAVGSYIAARMDTDQIANLAVTNHLQFNEIIEDGGIVLQGQTPTFDQTSGIFELKEGLVYYLYGDATVEFNGINDTAKIAWWDITNNVQLGQKGSSFPFSNSTQISTKHSAQTIFKPATDVNVELRITDLSGTITTVFAADTQANIFELGGGGGGTPSSTPITFPILYPEETIGSIGGPTQDINISGNDGQFKELTLTGNVNLTFSGFPSSTVLEEFWVLVNQDGVGGHSLTATGSTVKNAGTLDSLLDKAANAQTLFHFATGDAGTTIHADLVDLVASGGGFSGNLSDLVIDVAKDWAGFGITNLAGIDLFANAIANPVSNADVITFISNAAASRGQFGRSDFFGSAQGLSLNITANDNFTILVDTVQKVKFDDTADLITTEYDLNMMGGFITNIDYLESVTPNRPGDGFIRMASSDRIKIRNSANNDNVEIGFVLDSLGNQALDFYVAGGTQFTVSDFDIDVIQKDIINVRAITTFAGSGHDIGEVSEPFDDMYANRFRPQSIGATTADGYSRVGTNRHFVSFDSGAVDGGFGVYEDGIQKFLMSILFGTVHELFIGGDPFTAGEEYRIQLGENSGSSARIYFIEGVGNDLILDRAGGGLDQGVQVRVAGLSSQRWLSDEIKFFDNLNINSQEIQNVKNIYSDFDSGNNQIGAAITDPEPGGFNYFVNERITWEGDFDSFIEFSSGGITVQSDDDLFLVANDKLTLVSNEQMNIFVDASTGMTLTIDTGFPKFIWQDNAFIMADGTDLFVQDGDINVDGNILMDVGYLEIEDFGGDAPIPGGSDGRMFAKEDDDTGELTPFWIDPNGNVTSMLGGGGTPGGTGSGNSIVKIADETVVSSNILQLDDEFFFTPEPNTVYYLEFNLKYTTSFTQLKTGIQCGADATYEIVDENFDSLLEEWSPVSSSNVQSITHSNIQTDFKSTVFYAIVQVNSDTEPVGLSWSQNSNNPSPTTITKGSLMRFWAEGVNGGGGGDLFLNIVISTTADPDGDGFTDVDNKWFGVPFGAENLGISLGSVDPGSPTVSHTLTNSNFGSGLEGSNIETFGIYLSWNVSRPAAGGVDSRTFSQLYVNGSPRGTPFLSTGGTATSNTNIRGVIESNLDDVQVGDVIGVAVWEQTSSNLLFQHWELHIVPNEWNLNDVGWMVFTNPEDGFRGLFSEQPSFGTATPQSDEIPRYIVDGMDLPDSFGYPSENYNPVLSGSKMNLTNTISQTASGSFFGPSQNLAYPGFRDMNYYRYQP